MAKPQLPALVILFPQHQENRCRRPPQGASPIAAKGKHPHCDNGVVIDAIVRVGQVDGGNCVGAAECEEGGVLEENRYKSDFGGWEVEVSEEEEEELEKKENWDVDYS